MKHRRLRLLGRLLIASLVVLAAGLLDTPAAHACSCQPPATAADALRAADVVVAGQVQAIIPLGQPSAVEPRVLVVLRAERSWKGAPREIVVLDTVINAFSCEGYFFKQGESYLVYAYRKPDGALGVHLCSRTRELSAALDDLRALGAGVPVSSGSAAVWGLAGLGLAALLALGLVGYSRRAGRARET